MDPRIGKLKTTTFRRHRLTRRQIALMQETVGLFPNDSRRELARTPVENFGWTAPSGSYREQFCLRIMESGNSVRANNRPAPDFLHEDGLTALHIGMTECGFTDARPPPFDGYTIREAAIDIGRHLGFIPSRRQPLPGTEKTGTGMKCLPQATGACRAMTGPGYRREPEPER